MCVCERARALDMCVRVALYSPIALEHGAAEIVVGPHELFRQWLQLGPPAAPIWTQHWIAITNQHTTSMGTK